MMPLKNNDTTQQTKASFNKLKNLTEVKRDEARLARERLLETSSIIDAQGINLCRKFIKDLERAKITKDRNQISFFQVHIVIHINCVTYDAHMLDLHYLNFILSIH